MNGGRRRGGRQEMTEEEVAEVMEDIEDEATALEAGQWVFHLYSN